MLPAALLFHQCSLFVFFCFFFFTLSGELKVNCPLLTHAHFVTDFEVNTELARITGISRLSPPKPLAKQRAKNGGNVPVSKKNARGSFFVCFFALPRRLRRTSSQHMFGREVSHTAERDYAYRC